MMNGITKGTPTPYWLRSKEKGSEKIALVKIGTAQRSGKM